MDIVKALQSTSIDDAMQRQHEDIKKGGLVKVYYKATAQGLEVYKYVVKNGNTKTIYLKG